MDTDYVLLFTVVHKHESIHRIVYSYMTLSIGNKIKYTDDTLPTI